MIKIDIWIKSSHEKSDMTLLSWLILLEIRLVKLKSITLKYQVD